MDNIDVDNCALTLPLTNVTRNPMEDMDVNNFARTLTVTTV